MKIGAYGPAFSCIASLTSCISAAARIRFNSILHQFAHSSRLIPEPHSSIQVRQLHLGSTAHPGSSNSLFSAACMLIQTLPRI
ncbi:hypothetical protein POPTR_006G215866v4 [Populus trichocarpa]|uniref:Uncharacterized protein n=1 Tax=Populus trichocarpa TaxID=3694 RepID=A0ACC0SWJ4_POPTR|nr:hypothetical protein POPTR_006G215866v4 [Populus trichocarpa]